jgi:hypothetical protein
VAAKSHIGRAVRGRPHARRQAPRGALLRHAAEQADQQLRRGGAAAERCVAWVKTIGKQGVLLAEGDGRAEDTKQHQATLFRPTCPPGTSPAAPHPFGIVPLSNFVPRGFGFVHHSIAILYHEVPNPNLTIRNFFIAVPQAPSSNPSWPCPPRPCCLPRLPPPHSAATCTATTSPSSARPSPMRRRSPTPSGRRRCLRRPRSQSHHRPTTSATSTTAWTRRRRRRRRGSNHLCTKAEEGRKS